MREVKLVLKVIKATLFGKDYGQTQKLMKKETKFNGTINRGNSFVHCLVLAIKENLEKITIGFL